MTTQVSSLMSASDVRPNAISMLWCVCGGGLILRSTVWQGAIRSMAPHRVLCVFFNTC